MAEVMAMVAVAMVAAETAMAEEASRETTTTAGAWGLAVAGDSAEEERPRHKGTGPTACTAPCLRFRTPRASTGKRRSQATPAEVVVRP